MTSPEPRLTATAEKTSTPRLRSKAQTIPRAAALLPLMLLTGSCGGGGGGEQPPPIVVSPPTATPTPSPPSTPAAGTVLQADIKYGDGPTAAGTMPLLLDLYRPNENCSVARPTVVFVHGGGFVGGSRKGANVTAIADELVRLGVNLISIQYRLEGDNPLISSEFAPFERDYLALAGNQPATRVRAFTAAVEDTVRALRWIQTNAGQYCLDASRIGLWGSSAGAYTVLHTSYSLDSYAISRPAPRVVVDYWGGLFRDADLEAGEPPLFVLHGTADATVPYSEATELTQRAASVGVPFTFYSIAGGGHDYQGSGFATVIVDGQSIARKTALFGEAHLRDGGAPVYERRDLQR